MLAEKDEVFETYRKMLYVLNASDEVREKCRQRNDFYRYQRTVNRDLAEARKSLREKDQSLKEKDQCITELKQELAKLQQQLELEKQHK